MLNLMLYLVFALPAIFFLLLFLWEFKRRKELEKDAKVYQLDAVQKSYNVLGQAAKQVRNILGLAELESIKIIADTRVGTRKLDQIFEEKLNQILAETQKNFASQLTQTHQEFASYLQSLQAQSQQSQGLMEEYT